MSQPKFWITLLLTVILLALISWNIADFSDKTVLYVGHNQEPTYRSEHIVSMVYSPGGKLSYKLLAADVTYYNTGALTWFSQPVITLFNKDIQATWSVCADHAKLTKERMLYLYGHVEVDSLRTTSQLEKIKTDHVQIDLMTQDVYADRQVMLYGINFTSNGMKMSGNLLAETAELMGKVQTKYEI
ncbi:Lipopolysaccharide export system protein LptC [Serratia symbiotica]|nr:Lipopolysaccharide export system protein LptC [Serratia symbiotica]